MDTRFLIIALAAIGTFLSGCCNERIYRCPDGQSCGGILSGRHDGSVCGGCGAAPAQCRCGFLSHLKRKLTCGHGCGEMYWGEWISDPPDRCDPCGDCGEFAGPQCCGKKYSKLHRPWLGARYHNDEACGGACGAESCTAAAGHEVSEGSSSLPVVQ